MSTGPMFDQFWLFAVGVFVVPITSIFVTAVAVQQWASTRGLTLDASRYSIFTVTAILYFLMLFAGGLLLSLLRGIPPGIGFLGVLAFLLAVYAGPLVVGMALFGGFVSSQSSSPGEDGTPTRTVAETCVLFAGLHVAVFPMVYAVALLAS